VPRLFRTDQAVIHVTVSGVTIDDLSWDVLDGGDNTAQSVNYNPGGMAPSVAMGGIPKRSPVKVSRVWSDTLISAYKALDNGTGHLAVTVSYTNLDANGNGVVGSTITYTGILDAVARPGYDSGTASEAKLELTVDCNGAIT
jgi:hypothetical protein